MPFRHQPSLNQAVLSRRRCTPIVVIMFHLLNACLLTHINNLSVYQQIPSLPGFIETAERSYVN